MDDKLWLSIPCSPHINVIRFVPPGAVTMNRRNGFDFLTLYILVAFECHILPKLLVN